ncbi:hypothetical protein, partial [Limnohabitans sp. 2KL-17]|uniref:hypothetical protein n=1 Tax=Limnohabitans sp. 2KL-17 TaxID=1100704 RepID=UPI001E5CD4A2
RHRPFFTSAAGGRIGANCTAIAADFYITPTQIRFHKLGLGLKNSLSNPRSVSRTSLEWFGDKNLLKLPSKLPQTTAQQQV